jgi:hypothetical protein
MRRKLILAILGLVMVCGFAISLAAPAIASWTQSSIVSITSATATDSFTTTVVGVATNAADTPVTVDGVAFVSSDIAGYPLAVTGGNGGSPSTVTMTSGNFDPGTYVEFAVTITNTGTTTLAFQSVTQNCYFVDSNGVMIPYGNYGLFPAIATGYSAPQVNYVYAWADFAPGIVDTPGYLAYLDGSWNTNWVCDSSYQGLQSAFPTTLAPSATFTWYLYMGLGTNVPYEIPGCYFSVSIPLAPAS